MKNYAILFLLIVFVLGCEKEKTQAEKDDEIIREYLAEHNLEAIAHSSGLYYAIEEEGTGGHPILSSLIEVKYKGFLTNNVVFDETASSRTYINRLSALISGWQIGIPLLQKGGKGTFYIPSELGYGSSSAGSIPPNSVLIFEIELIGFNWYG